MTDERNKMDTDAETDAAVTQAYRETRDERIPESLNRAILDQAAKAARPRYSRIRLWTRPMAWAATAMLSVAIVLQLTQTPTPGNGSFDDGSYEVDAPTDVAAGRLKEAVRSNEAPGGAPNTATDAAPKMGALRSTAKQLAPAAASETRQRVEQSKANIANQALVEQEAAARLQEGEDQEAVPAQTASTDFASLELVREHSDPGRCDVAATTTAETWLQCITALEEAGLSDVADEERKLLTAAFPDFDTP